jgi:Carboxypeptidase regulatory-like domain/TonB dependent receptor
MRNLVFVCLLGAVSAACLPAQDVFATLGGTILDPSGLGVPKAKITVTNVERNQVIRTLTTDASGVYTAPLLPIGTYSVKVEADGFKTQTRSEITLNVSDDLKINMTLQVGSIIDTVEVKEAAVEVETGTATSATTIDGTQVRELALNTRNYEALVSLMPGVAIKANPADELFIGNSSPSGLSAQIPYSVNGNRTSANNWMVDGADNVDRGANLTLMSFPSVDSIAEFKVERSLYTADTGRAGGAQINVMTRSGTAQFHGSLYEFLRNDKLAANSWSNNVVGIARPALRWNDFGGTIGGPVWMGKHKPVQNKTFFFFSEEARRIHTYTTLNPVLPTPAMLTGAMPQPVCITVVTGGCPTGGTITNQIPANLINPIAQEYIKDIFSRLALPGTITGGFYPVQNIFNSRQEVIKIDQYVGSRLTLWGKFSNDSIPTTEPGGLFTGSAIPYVAITNTNSPGRIFVVHAVYSISPTLVSDASVNFSQSRIESSPQGWMSKANSPDINPPEPFANTQGVAPYLSFTSGSTLLGYGPYHERNRNLAFAESLTWIKGRHTFKFGGILTRYNKTENAANQEGNFSFTNAGVPTGTSSYYQSWANFLLGNVATFSMPSTDITPNISQWQVEAYAQDDIKLNSRLTMSAGLRWSFYGQLTGTNHLLDNFDPALYNKVNAPQIDPTNGNLIAGTGNNPNTNGIIVAGQNSPFGDHVGNQVYKNFAPRIGLAWDPFGDGKTSIRSGFGVYYDSAEIGRYESNVFSDPPYVQNISISNGSFSNITGGTTNVSFAPLSLAATQIPALIPYSMQWSFDVQRNLVRGVVLDIGYFGSKGTHLQGIVDINQAPPGAALAAGLHTVTASNPTIFTTTDDPRINAVRPYLGFNAINTIETAFNSNYHSLQVHIRKSFRSVGQLNASYTWSKVLTDSGSDSGSAPQSSYNWHEGEYGPYPGDRTQVLTLNYVYTVPFFAHGHGFAHQALGGWELSGIPTWYTGTPFTVTTSSVDPAGLGLLGASASSSRPDMICDPRANAPHAYGAKTGTGVTPWFNTACFVPVAAGAVRPGDAGRGVIRGPGFFGWDASLIKNFGLSKEDRVRLQFRGEAFNVLNWVNPAGFASTNITSTAFGQINSFRAPRRVQLALKLTF